MPNIIVGKWDKIVNKSEFLGISAFEAVDISWISINSH